MIPSRPTGTRLDRGSPVSLSRLRAATAPKYKAAFATAYGAGLRVSEVVALKVGDYRLGGRTVLCDLANEPRAFALKPLERAGAEDQDSTPGQPTDPRFSQPLPRHRRRDPRGWLFGVHIAQADGVAGIAWRSLRPLPRSTRSSIRSESVRPGNNQPPGSSRLRRRPSRHQRAAVRGAAARA
jgi:hypothetical protein